MLGSGTVSEVSPLSPSRSEGKWCVEGEKAMPPKKRRGRGGEYMMINTRESESNNNNNTNKKMKTRMKTKMNKKCTTLDNEGDRNEEEEEEEDERKEEVMSMEVNRSKKRGRGSVVMEGSRCSRVNGRGWRCCQQTLVGYSLCEHHLGKGRLRSITSVRTPSIPSSTTAPKNNINDASSSPSPDKKTKHDSSAIHNDIAEKKPAAVITKKRMKLGMVKARSISSLLGRTDNLVTLHDSSNK